MEARKAESEKLGDRRKVYNRLGVPDFKSLHAAQEAERALRKELITPIVPDAIELKTDGRARARHEFDEMMKEKERAIERAMEERKKEMEAEVEKGGEGGGGRIFIRKEKKNNKMELNRLAASEQNGVC